MRKKKQGITGTDPPKETFWEQGNYEVQVGKIIKKDFSQERGKRGCGKKKNQKRGREITSPKWRV